MPMQMTIHEDGRLLYLKATPPVSAKELRDIRNESQQYLDSVTFTVHSIADIRQIKVINPEAMRMDTFRNVTHPRQGFVAMVGANATLRSIANSIVSMLNYSSMRFFASEDEAFEWVRAAIAADKQKEAHAS